MERILIYNANIVNEGYIFKGSVVIKDDVIEEIIIGQKYPIHECVTIIDAEDSYLIPGVIDEHVHFREPGLTEKADIHTESIAAAAGGVTSIMDMPNTKPQTITIDAFEKKMDLMAKKCVVNYSCYFGATNDNIDVIHTLNPHRVCGVKVFMGSSTGNMLVDNKDNLTRIFAESEILIATHCESQQIINANIESFKSDIINDDLPIAYHSRIRSPKACIESSLLAIFLARKLKAHLHILHISTTHEIKLLSDRITEKKNITGEACVGYLLFSATDYKTKGSLIKINPALKCTSCKHELIHGINSGRIDAIATDHAPHLLSQKQGGAMKALSGMPMIQFSLISMLELVSKNIFTLPTIVEKMCHAPAKIYQIHQRGFIRLGYKADLVLVKKEDKPHIIRNEDVLSKCRWTPLDGVKVHWRITKTIVNGKIIYDGERVTEDYTGEELIFR